MSYDKLIIVFLLLNPFFFVIMSVHSTGLKNYTDEQLVRLYVDTQRNPFFEEIYDRYADKVYRKCLSFVKDQAKAEDFTHDIFLKLIVRVGSFKENSKFSTWLFSITYNYCMDQLRTAKKLAEDELTESVDVIDESDDVSEMEMDTKRLREVLNGISPEERTILLMKYQDDFSIKDIAETFGLTESAVKMRLKRTREKLRKRYTESLLFSILFLSKILILLKWWTKH
ncbi:RNA polymerase sigma factor [Runella slithyformis]|nr:sigma-70 family RNA polymerase sigma factor [Runella slithyformis]